MWWFANRRALAWRSEDQGAWTGRERNPSQPALLKRERKRLFIRKALVVFLGKKKNPQIGVKS